MNKKRTHPLLLSFFFITVALIPVSFSYAEVSANAASSVAQTKQTTKKLAYIVSDIRIPFWEIMSRGIKDSSEALGYELEIYSAENNAKHELENTVKALKNKVAGIIVSPSTSSACVTILKLAKRAGIPVVISDVGSDSGDYVSYISSNNREAAYQIGTILTQKMLELGWQNSSVGIVAIPQKRLNGQARTAGFMRALEEAGIEGADIKQQSTFTENETYHLSKEMINNTDNLRAIWLQTSNRYNGALRAIADSRKKQDILLITFDAEPAFLKLIPQGVIVGSAMQQPYLMGEKAVQSMHKHLTGEAVNKNMQLPILIISKDNIEEKLPVIKRNVLGMKAQEIKTKP